MEENKENEEAKKKQKLHTPKEGKSILSQYNSESWSQSLEDQAKSTATRAPESTGDPYASLSNYQLSSPYVWGSTGSMLGGTITILDNLKSTISTIESNIGEKISTDLIPIRNDLDTTKKVVEETTENLKNLRSFINNNEHLFTNLISVEGKMSGFEGQMSSLQNRVEKLESDKNINWNKTTTIISIIVAAIGTCCGIAGVIVAIISYLK